MGFDTPFSYLQNPILLSTSPYKKYTHWKQTVFYTEHDLYVRSGDVMYGSIACRKSKSNFRELDIKISYHIDAAQIKRDFQNMYKLSEHKLCLQRINSKEQKLFGQNHSEK